MRGAKWMALALVGMAPLMTLAQTTQGTSVQASPSGAASIDRGQDTAGTVGNFDTTGQPADPAFERFDPAPAANQPKRFYRLEIGLPESP